MFNVIESGSGKWVKMTDSVVSYTSNRSEATVFDDALLTKTDASNRDFSIFHRVMKLVPIGMTGIFNPHSLMQVRFYLQSRETHEKLGGRIFNLTNIFS